MKTRIEKKHRKKRAILHQITDEALFGLGYADYSDENNWYWQDNDDVVITVSHDRKTIGKYQDYYDGDDIKTYPKAFTFKELEILYNFCKVGGSSY